MSTKTIRAVKTQWSFCSIDQQKTLVLRFIEIHGAIHNIGDWYRFLAAEFSIKEKENLSSEIDRVFH